MAALLTNMANDIPPPVNFELMKGLLSAARKKLPFFNGTMPGELSKNSGSYSVKWERIENLAPVTTPLSEPVGNATFFNGRNAVKPTITNVTAKMEKYGNIITISEEVDLVQVNVRAMRLLDTLGRNAGESMNQIAQEQILAGITNVRYSGGVAGVTSIVTAVTKNDVKYIVNQLDRNSAMKFFAQGNGSTNVGTTPVRESYFAITHPDTEQDIRLLSGFKEVITYASHVETFPGEYGELDGVRFCSSEIAKITPDAATTSVAGFRGTSNTLNDVYDITIYGMEAIGSVGLGEKHSKETMEMGDRIPTVQLIQKAVGSSGVADPLDEVGSLSWKAFLVMQVLNPSWVFRLRALSASL